MGVILAVSNYNPDAREQFEYIGRLKAKAREHSVISNLARADETHLSACSVDTVAMVEMAEAIDLGYTPYIDLGVTF